MPDPVCGPARRVICSWCHATSRVYANRMNWCEGCGHQADRPRSECLCPECRPDWHRRRADEYDDRLGDGLAAFFRRLHPPG